MAATTETLSTTPFVDERREPEARTPARPGALNITQTPGRGATPASTAPTRKSPARRPGLWRAVTTVMIALVAGGAVHAYLVWPVSVVVVHPQKRVITETIAASGIVGGYREVVVGAQVNSGIVHDIRVVEGDHVKRGQVLAVVENRVAVAQVQQAEQTLRTARASLAQQSARSLPSQIQALQGLADQARATIAVQATAVLHAQSALKIAKFTAAQAVEQAANTRAAADKAVSLEALTAKTRLRTQSLYDQGAIALQNVDQADTDDASALRDMQATDDQAKAATTALQSAQTAVQAAEQDVATAQQNLAGARYAWHAAVNNLGTQEAQPRVEVVDLAKQQVRDAALALAVAQAQAHETAVRAPFDGIVTQITGEPGAYVTTAGVVHLIGTDQPEIRIQTDENNLQSLHVGEEALITSVAYPDAHTTGKVIRIGAQVDSSSGTVEVDISYDLSLAWLRPGQTVNVNLITHPMISRLLIPSSSVKQLANRDIVLLIKDGRAVARTVKLGPPVGAQVPVMSGLMEGEAAELIRNSAGVDSGERIRQVGEK